jgi:hypothetical protein
MQLSSITGFWLTASFNPPNGGRVDETRPLKPLPAQADKHLTVG